jgi:FKBP-type peptidyl-prolyl cis-trans isomerase SlyD
MSPPVVELNSHVTLGYVLRTREGVVIDASARPGGEPIRYVHGYGMIVPGLEAAVLGMRVGERKRVELSAEEAYGTPDEQLVVGLDRADFPDPDTIVAGEEFSAESPDGGEIAVRVVEVKDDIVVVDANHPLAGMDIVYEVEVEAVRGATDEEIAAAAAALEEARLDAEGPDGTPANAVVPLGRKPNGGPAVFDPHKAKRNEG